MRLRNLQIDEIQDENLATIKDGVLELGIIIDDNYQDVLSREIAIEFNIGSRLGEVREYLIVYNNPEYKNNPYVFVLDKYENALKDRVSTETFRALTDEYARKNINHTLGVGFKHLPDHWFLSEQEILCARDLAQEYDKTE